LNPHIQVELYEEPLTSENALRIGKDYDVIVDGTDNFPTRYLVNDACVILGKPNVYGSIFKFEGQASVFNYQGGPNYRDLYPEPPPPGLVPSCAEGGVLGVLPGIIGTIQATETIKILLGLGTTLSGRLLLFDALNMKFRELKLRCDPGAPKIERLIDYEQFCGIPKQQAGHSLENTPVVAADFAKLSVEQIHARLSEGWKPFVLDVRNEKEAAIVRFPWADALIPHTEVGTRLAEIPKDREILVHCKLGGRSSQAAKVLAEAGYQVTNMEGGITAWAKVIDPSMPVY
jgi:adenylyltransferase/sulfurtransferase